MAEVRTITASDAITHVAIDGRLDIEGVGRVELTLTASTVARKKPTLIDMTKVEFLGSMGMGLLIRCAMLLQRQACRCVLYGCQPQVIKTLETAKVTTIISMADTETEARLLLGTD